MNREGTPLPVFRVVMNRPAAPQTQSAPASNTASGPDWTPRAAGRHPYRRRFSVRIRRRRFREDGGAHPPYY